MTYHWQTYRSTGTSSSWIKNRSITICFFNFNTHYVFPYRMMCPNLQGAAHAWWWGIGCPKFENLLPMLFFLVQFHNIHLDGIITQLRIDWWSVIFCLLLWELNKLLLLQSTRLTALKRVASIIVTLLKGVQWIVNKKERRRINVCIAIRQNMPNFWCTMMIY